MRVKLRSKISHNVLIAILALIWLIPIIWLVCTSFSAYDGMNTSTFFPANWSAKHYVQLFRSESLTLFAEIRDIEFELRAQFMTHHLLLETRA